MSSIFPDKLRLLQTDRETDSYADTFHYFEVTGWKFTEVLFLF